MNFAVASTNRRFELSQFDAAPAREVGVEVQNLDRKVDLINDALAGRLLPDPKFEVVEVVVRFASVLVMNVLAFAKRPTKRLFHDQLVFEASLSPTHPDSHIAGRVEVAVGVYGTPRTTGVSAGATTKSLLLLPPVALSILPHAGAVVRRFATGLALKSRHWFIVHVGQLLQMPMLVKEIA